MSERKTWIVVYSRTFREWLNEQDEDLQDDVFASLNLLRERGPMLGRPFADTLKGSKLSNLKELRVQHKGAPIRAFFAFDPVRRAIVLCAGGKTGDKRFYERMIPIAEAEFERFLSETNLEFENAS